MKSNRVLYVFLMAALLLDTAMVAIVSMVNIASAPPTTNIYVFQALITVPPANPAGFPVDVYVTDAPSTYAWEVHLTWDPNLLELFFQQEGEFLHRGPLGGPKVYDTTFTTYPGTFAEANVKGEILVGCTLNNPLDPWATGDGRLFRLGFRVKTAAYGSTLINLFDTVLLDHLEAGSPAPTLYPNSDSFFYNVDPSHDITGRARYINPWLSMWVYAGEVAKINVTVLNEGTVSETVTLNVYANASLIDTTSLQLNGTAGLGGSFENRSRTYTVNWDTTGYAVGKYNITASVPAVTGETDTADNSFAGEHWVWVLPGGDINYDGVVDSADLAILADAYGSTPTSPNWDYFADINKDSKVEVADLFILGKDYGKSI